CCVPPSPFPTPSPRLGSRTRGDFVRPWPTWVRSWSTCVHRRPTVARGDRYIKRLFERHAGRYWPVRATRDTHTHRSSIVCAFGAVWVFRGARAMSVAHRVVTDGLVTRARTPAVVLPARGTLRIRRRVVAGRGTGGPTL